MSEEQPTEPVYDIIDPAESEELATRDAQALAQHYLDLIRRPATVRVDPIRVFSLRRPLQIVGAVCALACYAATARLLLQPLVDPAARPPAAVLAIEAEDPCIRQQAEIMRAVAAYTREHRKAPQDIDDLKPQYFAAVPADPISGQPYEYVHQGSAVVVACPNPDRHDTR